MSLLYLFIIYKEIIICQNNLLTTRRVLNEIKCINYYLLMFINVLALNQVILKFTFGY